MFAVAGAKQPIALASLVLDAKIVTHGDQLGVELPPFAADPLGPVGAFYAAAHAALGERDRRVIGKECDRLNGFRLGQQA